MLRGKRVILGVTGSIAAYKSALLVRELVKAGAEVRVVMTPSACEFITPLTLATLSRAEVVLDMFPGASSRGTWHIDLALWADVMLVAPASANTIARLAHGMADNALAALALALRCPLVIAPAMDTDMFTHPATQDNLEALRRRGAVVIPPDSGDLASGLTGEGRLVEIPAILETLEDVLFADGNDLAGMRVLVTAGPTHERIDPVRFIGNHSSGKMGFALAHAAARRGAIVTLVAGPVQLATPRGVRRVDVTTAEEMFAAVSDAATDANIVVMAAAVADYRAAEYSERKLKKDAQGEGEMLLRLQQNPDILRILGQRKRNQILIGFALETHDDEANARLKLAAKNADMIVLNNPTIPGAGFGTDTNIATLLFADGSSEHLDLLPKTDLARIIIDRAIHLLTTLSLDAAPASS
ncbi:MAG: bifunctional phosphopantothenoylcysteine decarboxylase/phosphopantothenate--cysteine ligase CoaBC [Ignavibacteria bacterium]|nr:bifunctional phosphopantothenoylcysteine decarboxylase/phosphopantothenate--cysteine ligase CoaBC [Ignavibacteria bacterium]